MFFKQTIKEQLGKQFPFFFLNGKARQRNKNELLFLIFSKVFNFF